MSEPRSNSAIVILLTLLLSSMAPMASADSSEEVIDDSQSFEPVFGNLDDMVLSESHPYMMPDTDERLYSATRLMKNAWIDEGMPPKK